MPAESFQVTGLLWEDARQRLRQSGWQTDCVCLTRALGREWATRTPLRVVRVRQVGPDRVQLVVVRECPGLL